MKFSEKQIISIVAIFKYLNLSMIILAILLTFLSLVINKFSLSILFALVPAAAFYSGFKYRQPWIIPVMILLGSFGTISYLFLGANGTLQVIVKNLALFVSLFQLYFFSRKEVRKYFRSRGIYLFS